MTLCDVAERAGVAPDTARRALRDHPSVRPYIKERVLKAAKDLDYHPNLLARALKQNALRLVPISILDLDQLYFGQLATQLSRCLVDAGFEPALCFNPEHLLRLSQTLSTSASLLVTGFSEKTIRTLSRRQKVVTVDSCLPPMANVGNVAIDFAGAYRRVTDASLRQGRRHIALCSVHHVRCLAEGWNDPKFGAVLAALTDAGLAPVGPGPQPVFADAASLARWLEAHPRSIDAIWCGSDIEAAHVVGMLAALRLRMPRDVRVVGCDANCVLAGTWSLKLDTVYLAAQAIGLLLRLLDGETRVEEPVYVPKLVDETGKEVAG